MPCLQNKHILLGITGGIAAYKSAELVRLLTQEGADVRVVMSQSAQAFITPLTLQALSKNPVHTHLLDPEAEAGMGHIELARWADIVIVAPATANLMARLGAGLAEDLLATLCLATKAPIAIAPAMNQAMWSNPATQQNLITLKSRSIKIWGPAEGQQACGDVGYGRMLEPSEILENTISYFRSGVLTGKTVVITAGPTQEAIDPVRYISNHSSGKMGYALAAAAIEAGAQTILISGPTSLSFPTGATIVHVQTAEQMLTQALTYAAKADLFIGAAAVADYRPLKSAQHKIKKGSSDSMHLELTKNPDIVASVANSPQRPFTVGFAAETENLLEYAKQKLISKNLDLIIANDVSDSSIGFNSDSNAVTIIARGDQETGYTAIPSCTKEKLAKVIIQHIANRIDAL